jgi:hypothetical protein
MIKMAVESRPFFAFTSFICAKSLLVISFTTLTSSVTCPSNTEDSSTGLNIDLTSQSTSPKQLFRLLIEVAAYGSNSSQPHRGRGHNIRPVHQRYSPQTAPPEMRLMAGTSWLTHLVSKKRS